MSNWKLILKAGFLPSKNFTTFVVKDEIWNEANPVSRMASIEEVELGLGRKLTIDDFNHLAMVNWQYDRPVWVNMGAEEEYKTLMDRLGGEAGRAKLALMWLNSPERKETHERTLNWFKDNKSRGTYNKVKDRRLKWIEHAKNIAGVS